ncbi:matrix-remodeling-associated protein 5-like [Vanacampus margaritifer]
MILCWISHSIRLKGCKPALTLKMNTYPSAGVLLAIWALLVPGGQSCPKSCNCYQASEVHCTFRSLLTVPPGLPAHTRRINLGFNSISRIHDSSLAGLQRLELLMLHSNDIHHLPDALFRDLKSLQILKLSYNKLTEIPSSQTFSGLTSLLRLYLDHNHLQYIHPRALLQLPSLRLLRLQGNRLHQLHPHALCTLSLLNTYYFSTLRHLDVSNNSLSTLPKAILQTASMLETLALQANPWSCDCRMSWFPAWLFVHSDLMKCSGGPQCPICEAPSALQGQSVLDQKDLTCTSPVITLRGEDTPSETELGEILPSESFREPLGAASLELSDQQGNSVVLGCNITHSTDSQDGFPAPDLSHPSSSPIAMALSFSLECPVEKESYDSLWRILAYYSETAVHLERELMLNKAPKLAYRYRQTAETEGYYNTGVKASISTGPHWLMQPAIGIQLNRAHSSRDTVSLIYSTRVSAHPDPTTRPAMSTTASHPWVLILTNQTTTAVTAAAGARLELSCSLLSSSYPKVKWILPDGSKLNSPFSSQDGRIQVSGSRLLLQNVERSDAGIYYCVAQIGKDSDVLPLRLVVEGSSAPPTGEQVGPPVTGRVGQPASLSCKASGSPEPQTFWMLPNGNIVHNGLPILSGFTLQSNGSLFFPNPSLRDAGHYRCVAVNQYGSASVSINLEINPRKTQPLGDAPVGPQSASGRSTKIRAPLFRQIEEGSGDLDEEEQRTIVIHRKQSRIQQPSNRKIQVQKPLRRGPLREGPLRRGGRPQSPEQRRNRYTTHKQKIDPLKWADLLAKIRQKTAANNSEDIVTEKPTAKPLRGDEDSESQGGGDNTDTEGADGSEMEGSSVDDAVLREESFQPIYPTHTVAVTTQAKTESKTGTESQESWIHDIETENVTPPQTTIQTDLGSSMTTFGTNEIDPDATMRPSKPQMGPMPNLVPNAPPQSPWNSRRRIGQRRRVNNRTRGRPMTPRRPLIDHLNPMPKTVVPETTITQLVTTTSLPTIPENIEDIETPFSTSNIEIVNPPPSSVPTTVGITTSTSELPAPTPSSPTSLAPYDTETNTDVMTHSGNIPDSADFIRTNNADPFKDIPSTTIPALTTSETSSPIYRKSANPSKIPKSDTTPSAPFMSTTLTTTAASSTAASFKERPNIGQVSPKGRPASGAPHQSRPPTDWRYPGANFIPDSHSSRPQWSPSPLPADPRSPALRSRPRIADPHIRTMSFPAGNVARLTCEAQGEPKPSITWTKVATGAVMSVHSRAQRFEVLANGTLVIQNVQLQDRGTYICSAHNFLGRDRLLTTLEVWTRPPRMQLASYREATIHQGGEVHLECQASGVPTPLLSWVLPNRAVLTSMANSSNRISMDSNGTLHISSTLPSDRGAYRCVASNSAGAASASVRLHVSSFPPVIQQPREESLLLAQGGPFYAHCTARGAPPPNLRWRVPDGALVRPSQFLHGNLFVLPNGTLHIRKIGPKDVGSYECTSFNAVGTDKRTVRVEIKEEASKARIVSTSPPVTAVSYGDNLQLHCSVTGNPPPIIIWRTPSRKLVDMHFSFDQRLKVHQNGTLSVQSVTELDVGDYLCIARNKVADDYRLLRVSVVIKPAKIEPKQPFNQMVSFGKALKVDCLASGLPDPAVSWSLPDGTMVNSVLQGEERAGRGRRLVVFHNGTLLVPAVGRGEEGEYTCYAENQGGQDTMKVHVKVMMTAPPTFDDDKSYQVIKVRQGATAVIRCQATGDPPPTVTWFSPAHRVIPASSGFYSDRVAVASPGTLEVRQAQKIDTGNYTCRASNSAGERNMVVGLEVDVPNNGNNGYGANNGRIRIINGMVLNPVPRSDSENGFKKPNSGITTQLGRVVSIGVNRGANTGIQASNSGTMNRNAHGTLHSLIRNGHSSIREAGDASNLGARSNEVAAETANDANPSRDTTVSRNAMFTSSVTKNGDGRVSWVRGNSGVTNDKNRSSATSAGTSSTSNKLVGVVTTGKQRIMKGQTVLLPCPSHGSPPLTWYLPGNGVLPAPYYGSRLTVHRNGTLELRAARLSDSGTLVCVVSGEKGETRIQVELEVSEPQEASRPLSSVASRSAAAQQASQTGQLLPVVPHPPIPVSQKTLPSGPSSLVAADPVGPPSPSAISAPAVSTQTASLMSITNGETLRLPCSSSQAPKHSVGSLSWTFPSGKVLSRGESGDSGRYLVQEDGTLVIQQASVFDRGTYTCRSTSPDTSLVSLVTVPVIIIAYPPRITTGPSPVTYTRPGVAVELPCLTIATPRAMVTWETPDMTQLRVLGQARIYGNRYLSPRGSLVIQKPSSRDTGFYRCTAKNVIGVDTKTTYLHVI